MEASKAVRVTNNLRYSIEYGIRQDESPAFPDNHYSDVMMGAMPSQITSVTIVYSTVYYGPEQRKHQSSASLAGEFHARMASNAENVSI